MDAQKASPTGGYRQGSRVVSPLLVLDDPPSLSPAGLGFNPKGRGIEILLEVAGLPGEILDGRYHDCPVCDSLGTFRVWNREAGTVWCVHCLRAESPVDVAAAWANQWSLDTARGMIAHYLAGH